MELFYIQNFFISLQDLWFTLYQRWNGEILCSKRWVMEKPHWEAPSSEKVIGISPRNTLNWSADASEKLHLWSRFPIRERPRRCSAPSGAMPSTSAGTGSASLHVSWSIPAIVYGTAGQQRRPVSDSDSDCPQEKADKPKGLTCETLILSDFSSMLTPHSSLP